MTAWNQGGLYTLKLVSQRHPEFKQLALLGVMFNNCAIDSVYFEQCLDMAFVGDSDVVGVDSVGLVTFTRQEVLQEGKIIKFLEEKSKLLLDQLLKHPDWGKVGGPNLKAAHETLE